MDMGWDWGMQQQAMPRPAPDLRSCGQRGWLPVMKKVCVARSRILRRRRRQPGMGRRGRETVSQIKCSQIWSADAYTDIEWVSVRSCQSHTTFSPCYFLIFRKLITDDESNLYHALCFMFKPFSLFNNNIISWKFVLLVTYTIRWKRGSRLIIDCYSTEYIKQAHHRFYV